MKKLDKSPKGYNVYQLRLYNLKDQLTFKYSYVDKVAAQERMLQYFTEEHEGPLYSRGTVRCLDPVLKSWITPLAINNPRALLFDPEMSIADEWQFSIYNISDHKMEVHRSETVFSDETVKMVLQNRNAFYGVISAREPDSPQELFVISRIIVNELFNLCVSDTNPAPRKKNENLALTFAKALAEDRAETMRIQKEYMTQGNTE